MQELLKRFVEVAPKEWFGELGGWGGNCRVRMDGVREDRQPIYIICGEGPHDDRASSEAIIFLWDWLDMRLGGLVDIHAASCGRRTNMWAACHVRKPLSLPAPTRIEALVRAVIAVQEAKNG